jgi:hypothetical protein
MAAVPHCRATARVRAGHVAQARRARLGGTELQLSFDQRALLFSCEDSEHALLDALREINHLIEGTNRLSRGGSQT